MGVDYRTALRLRNNFQESQRLAYRRYEVHAGAEWIVLLPGAGASAAIWRRQIPYFKRTHNLLVIDLPGHGRSDRGKEDEEYSFEKMAGDIVALLDKEGLVRVHLVSMSLGGLLAETIALLYPERVRSLVLAGGIAKLSTWVSFLMNSGRVLSRVLPYLFLYRIFAWIIMPGAAHAKTRKLFAAHAKRLGRREFMRWYEMSGQVDDLLRRAEKRSTSIATLFIMGDADYLFAKYASERARERADTELVVIAECGHVCSVERPDNFNDRVEGFLKGVSHETSDL